MSGGDTSYFASTIDISRLEGGGGGECTKHKVQSTKIFVVFCSHKELPGLVFVSSLRISALLCQPSLISSVAANGFGN